jgi:hypothetical protein
MARRVIIDSTAASPLRVSVAGVDAAGAEFNDLLFDGNQSPLRLWGTGWAFAQGFSQNDYSGGKNINEGTPVLVLQTPPGTRSIFICNSAFQSGATPANGRNQPPWRNVGTAGTSGGGGGICSTDAVGANMYFVPVCFNTGLPTQPTVPGNGQYNNYAIFKNYM